MKHESDEAEATMVELLRRHAEIEKMRPSWLDNSRLRREADFEIARLEVRIQERAEKLLAEELALPESEPGGNGYTPREHGREIRAFVLWKAIQVKAIQDRYEREAWWAIQQ